MIGGRFCRIVSERDTPRSSGRVFTFSDGTMTASVELGLVDGTWQPIGFDVRSYVPNSAAGDRAVISARGLRAVPFGALVDEALVLLKEAVEEEAAQAGPESYRDADGQMRVSIPNTAARRGLERLRGPGRPRRTYEEAREDARIYIEHARFSRRPTEDLAAAQNISRSGAAKRVQRARALGLIPPAQKRALDP